MTTNRFQSVDYLRGLVMVLMAIDHVRVYSGVPAWSPEVDIFFTRWITHFCAPAFAFFAGTSAYFYGAKVGKSELTKFLLSRGLLLVILELTVIRFLWSFHLGTDFILAGVIWMLGWCMILLTLFIRLDSRTIGVIGVCIILGQQLFGYVPSLLPDSWQPAFAPVWEFIYPSGFETFKGINILYVIIPWLGIMAAGYGFGNILQSPDDSRRKYCLTIGVSLFAAYLVIASVLVMNSEPNDFPQILRVLNQNKYPASILFTMMTLGPIIALVPFAEKAKGWVSNSLITIGRVAFFYYLAHIV
ncbi:MAG: DUF1624 domain-containing protein, partial [Cyclobacteriaceae bacterium]|nr:DUF1624 domain-containing protein [Cyclobacteriaceae bacterium]